MARLIEATREKAEVIDKLYAVYVVGGEGRLADYLKIRDVLLAPPDARVDDFARPDAVAVRADTDREEVLRLAKRERLKVLPVLDAAGRLAGMVMANELREIERAEAVEDMKLMAGLAPDATAADGPFRIVPRRLPWPASGFVGSGIAALVVGAYADALTEAAILASLIPIAMSLAGNAGIQASTVTVQAISSGALWIGDIWGRLIREIGGAFLNGGTVGLLVGLGIIVLSQLTEIERPEMLTLAAVLTLIVVTIQASAIGSLVPLALARLRFDPAVATGVFITTSNDVVGVLVSFVKATAIYL